MPLVNGLPVKTGNLWSSSVPDQLVQLITVWNLDEKLALMTDPSTDIAWADRGTTTGQGLGVVNFAHSLPQAAEFMPFKKGARHYNKFDAVVTAVHPEPFDLNFVIPMIWDTIGNGYMLMSREAGSNNLIPFLGIDGIAPVYVMSARKKRVDLIASLFFNSFYCTGSGLSQTSPTMFTYRQPNNPNGIALFSDGTGAEGSGGAQHYANPVSDSSGRFKNVYSAWGDFPSNYGRSLAQMAVKPHSIYNNVTSGAKVTDTIGPTYMREKFWRMYVQELAMEVANGGGGGAVAAAVTNPYAYAASRGITEDNFIGNPFGPRKFWIAPQLDAHPYAVASSNKDMWVNVSTGVDRLTGAPRPTWAKVAGNSKDFAPWFKFYGPGDPQADRDREMRFEGNLDGGAAPGSPGEIDIFFET